MVSCSDQATYMREHYQVEQAAPKAKQARASDCFAYCIISVTVDVSINTATTNHNCIACIIPDVGYDVSLSLYTRAAARFCIALVCEGASASCSTHAQ